MMRSSVAKHHLATPRRLSILLLIIFLSLSFWLVIILPVYAQQLTNRSIQVSTALPSATAAHNFSFGFVTSAGSIGSVVFEYCENSPLFNETCDPPPGLDVSSAILVSQTGNTGFTFDGADSTANKIVISRVPSAPATVPSSYSFSNITNPSASNHSEFIRVGTYATANGSGAFTDFGAVAFATNAAFVVGAYVPPYLKFCVAITVAVNCAAMSGDSINLGILTPSQPRFATSQFSTSTNDPNGFVDYVLGNTMTSGNNVITSSTSPTPSLPGSGQFGINLRANTSPSIGQEPSGSGTGVPSPNYSVINSFKFANGDPIATSSIPTDYNRMTVSYLVNIPGSQPGGVYNTTLTYAALVQF